MVVLDISPATSKTRLCSRVGMLGDHDALGEEVEQHIGEFSASEVMICIMVCKEEIRDDDGEMTIPEHNHVEDEVSPSVEDMGATVIAEARMEAVECVNNTSRSILSRSQNLGSRPGPCQ